MANPHSANFAQNPVPKLIPNSKYKVRRDVIETVTEIVNCSTVLPSAQDRTLYFKIERGSKRCINLSLMKIHLELVVRDKHNLDSKTLEERVKALIPGNVFATLFKDVVLKLNGVAVTDSNGLYPFISDHLLLTKVNPVYRKASEQGGRIYRDCEDTRAMPKFGEAEYQDVGLDPTLFKDLSRRQEQFQIGREYTFNICLYLFTDLTSAPTSIVLPPSVTAEIELHPNSPQKSIILDKIGILEPTIVITKAELIVPRVTPANGVPKSLRHQFMRVSAQPVMIPANTTNLNTVMTFPGQMPSRLSLRFCSMASYDGNYADNMYASTPRGLDSITFSVAGKQYPTTPIKTNFERNLMSDLYMRTCESLRFSLDRTGMSLPNLEDWASREFLFSADISSDYSSDSNWVTNPEEHGAVAMSLHFARPTAEPHVAIVISESVATLAITSEGDISLE